MTGLQGYDLDGFVGVEFGLQDDLSVFCSRCYVGGLLGKSGFCFW